MQYTVVVECKTMFWVVAVRAVARCACYKNTLHIYHGTTSGRHKRKPTVTLIDNTITCKG